MKSGKNHLESVQNRVFVQRRNDFEIFSFLSTKYLIFVNKIKELKVQSKCKAELTVKT